LNDKILLAFLLWRKENEDMNLESVLFHNPYSIFSCYFFRQQEVFSC
jgi:hypothetical protein